MEHHVRCGGCWPRRFLFYWYVQLLVFNILLQVLTVLLVSAIIETKNLTLEETGTLFGVIGATEPVVSATRNITHNSASSEEEKASQIFHVYD